MFSENCNHFCDEFCARLGVPKPSGEKRILDSELWHVCAGPLVSLPAVGSRVVYFPQGHGEQVPRVSKVKKSKKEVKRATGPSQ